MKKILFLPCLWVQICFGSVDETVQGIRKIEIAQKICPVLWEKGQLCTVLQVLKKCHDRVRETEKEEQSQLEKIKDEVRKAEIEIMTQGKLPDIKVSDKIKKLVEECKKKRDLIVLQNVQEVNKILDIHLKPWQKKALGLSEKTPQGWIEFVRYTFLDLICYEILNSILKRLDPKQAEGLK